jgi:hypothetical protein
MSEPLNPYASPQADTTGEGGGHWTQDLSPVLRQVGLGIGLIYWGIILAVVCVLMLAATVPFLGFSRQPGAVMWAVGMTIIVAGWLGLLLAAILMFVGPMVCLVVPAESGGKGFLIASVLCHIGTACGFVFSLFNIAPISDPFTTVIVLGAISLCAAAGFALLVLFLKTLSAFLGRADLVERARNVLIGFGILVFLCFLMFGGLAAEIPAFGFFAILIAIGGLILLAMYASLLYSLWTELEDKGTAAVNGWAIETAVQEETNRPPTSKQRSWIRRQREISISTSLPSGSTTTSRSFGKSCSLCSSKRPLRETFTT